MSRNEVIGIVCVILLIALLLAPGIVTLGVM